jgi:DNA repair protein RadA/Sms
LPKLTLQYVCTECGATSAKWMGRCPSCGRWQTLAEEVIATETPAKRAAAAVSAEAGSKALRLSEVGASEQPRLSTGISEFDRVLGGGLVPGALVLLSGDPGIGKSTLILQACQKLSSKGLKVLYASGEESASQIALRAKRIGAFNDQFLLLSETRFETIYAAVEREKPAVLVIDSIQTLMSDEIPSAAGSVTQVRECAARLMALAKPKNLAVFVIGHVTKDGSLAGPRTLEHLVDAVLSFEGEKHSSLRAVRATKNRFGSTLELGLFEMADDGLRQVANPSEYFLRSRLENASGSVAFVSLEGSRPMLTELQALVAPTHWGNPQRSSTGLDPYRLGLLYAVLEKRCGVNLYNQDVFVSVTGGLRLDEPAVDLAACAAVASALRSRAVPHDWVAFGEVGLGGELRPVAQTEARLREAARLGFKKALIPKEEPKAMERLAKLGIPLCPVRTLEDALKELADA